MKLFNKLRQKIPFSDMIYFTYVCLIQRSVLKEYQFLEAEIFFSFWMAPYSVVYRLVLRWVIGLTQGWETTIQGSFPGLILFLLDSVYDFKTFHRVMGTDPGLYTEGACCSSITPIKVKLSKSKRLLERRVTLERGLLTEAFVWWSGF